MSVWLIRLLGPTRTPPPLFCRARGLPREKKLGFHLPQRHCAMESGHGQRPLTACELQGRPGWLVTQPNRVLSLLPHWPEPQPGGAGGRMAEKPERARLYGWWGILRISNNGVFIAPEVPKPDQIQGQVKRIQVFLGTKVDFVTFYLNSEVWPFIRERK